MLFHKIQYVGKKPSRADTVAGTNLVWTPGQVHAVEETAAKKLLAHPDIWESIGAEEVAPDKRDVKIAVAKPAEKKKEQEEPFEVANLDTLDRPALAAYAKRNFNTNLNPVASKKADMIMTIRQLQNKALAAQDE